MAKRIIVAVIFLPLLLLAIFAVSPAFPVVLPILVALMTMLGAYEGLWNTGFVRHVRPVVYSAVMAAVIPFWSYYSGDETALLFGAFIYVTALFCEAIGSHKQFKTGMVGTCIFFGAVVPYFLSSLLHIRLMDGWRGLILLPFVAAFVNDACALFAGKLFGKRKLAPELSPKKTVEGAIGGFCGAVLGMILYGLILSAVCGAEVNYLLLALYGALGSVAAQLGDLFFSYIKRESGIKDYGTLFPGHGGALDRLDSVMFCAPLMELLLCVLPAIHM